MPAEDVEKFRTSAPRVRPGARGFSLGEVLTLTNTRASEEINRVAQQQSKEIAKYERARLDRIDRVDATSNAVEFARALQQLQADEARRNGPGFGDAVRTFNQKADSLFKEYSGKMTNVQARQMFEQEASRHLISQSAKMVADNERVIDINDLSSLTDLANKISASAGQLSGKADDQFLQMQDLIDQFDNAVYGKDDHPSLTKERDENGHVIGHKFNEISSDKLANIPFNPKIARQAFDSGAAMIADTAAENMLTHDPQGLLHLIKRRAFTPYLSGPRIEKLERSAITALAETGKHDRAILSSKTSKALEFAANHGQADPVLMDEIDYLFDKIYPGEGDAEAKKELQGTFHSAIQAHVTAHEFLDEIQEAPIGPAQVNRESIHSQEEFEGTQTADELLSNFRTTLEASGPELDPKGSKFQALKLAEAGLITRRNAALNDPYGFVGSLKSMEAYRNSSDATLDWTTEDAVALNMAKQAHMGIPHHLQRHASEAQYKDMIGRLNAASPEEARQMLMTLREEYGRYYDDILGEMQSFDKDGLKLPENFHVIASVVDNDRYFNLAFKAVKTDIKDIQALAKERGINFSDMTQEIVTTMDENDDFNAWVRSMRASNTTNTDEVLAGVQETLIKMALIKAGQFGKDFGEENESIGDAISATEDVMRGVVLDRYLVIEDVGTEGKNIHEPIPRSLVSNPEEVSKNLVANISGQASDSNSIFSFSITEGLAGGPDLTSAGVAYLRTFKPVFPEKPFKSSKEIGEETLKSIANGNRRFNIDPSGDGFNIFFRSIDPRTKSAFWSPLIAENGLPVMIPFDHLGGKRIR